LYGTTATTLFNDLSDWYAPVRRLDLTHERYRFLFRILGADLLEITINASVNDGEQDAIAETVWGSFNQHNDVVSKLEQHFESIGKRSLFENLTTLPFDDDKLRHTSKTFSNYGLQRTGFCGGLCGPVMNGADSVQHGLLMAIYFSRKGDSVLSTVQSLCWFVGLWRGTLSQPPHGCRGICRSRISVCISHKIFIEDALPNPGNSFRKS
jgi:hypothetical protein